MGYVPYFGLLTDEGRQATWVVKVITTKKHAFYGKIIRTSKCYHAHDEGNESKIGDKVEIMATRPLSKLKRWRISKIVEKALG